MLSHLLCAILPFFINLFLEEYCHKCNTRVKMCQELSSSQFFTVPPDSWIFPIHGFPKDDHSQTPERVRFRLGQPSMAENGNFKVRSLEKTGISRNPKAELGIPLGIWGIWSVEERELVKDRPPISLSGQVLQSL